MTRHSQIRPPASRRRAGFTLIELMIVIAIIAVLAAILVPAVSAVLSRARLTTVKTEMSGIGTSIADFESQFGQQPPSFITFDTTNPNWSATRAILRKMFPEISFTADADGNGTVDVQEGLELAGLWGQTLYGPEALVFFLGGVRRGDGTTFSNEMVGFSKNPANPFAQPLPGQSNRIGPFFEFDAARLGEVTRDLTTGTATVNTDPDSFTGKPLAYLDELEGQGQPLIYVSTARTKSYVPTDSGLIPNPDTATAPFPWTPYQKSEGSFYGPSTFQLISPGYDGEYGEGGVHNDENPADGLDADNLTNFSEGPLGG